MKLSKKHADDIMMNLDVEAMQRLFPHADPEALLISLHRARVECTGLPSELRHESAHWLRERGYSRLNGLALPEEGELP